MFVNNQRDRYVECYCTGACRSSGICPNSKGISPIKNCLYPAHNPPTHLHVTPGQTYIHICPICHSKTEIISPNIIC